MRQLTVVVLLAGVLGLGPGATRASAVTVEEIFSLKANGLSDDILVALIETDGSVFQLQPEDIVTLFRRGLSERVILAMIGASRRMAQPQAVPAFEAPTPQPVQTIVQPVQVVNQAPVEVYVPVAVPVNVFVPVRRERPDRQDGGGKSSSTTYWGYGGQLRPDAWGQPARAASGSSGDTHRGAGSKDSRDSKETDRTTGSRRR